MFDLRSINPKVLLIDDEDQFRANFAFAFEDDLDIQNAIPCGLFLNEAITNAYKHAFEENGSGEIKIQFGKSENGVKLSIIDNGKGFTNDFALEKAETTGMTLLKTFADQLEGNVSIESNGITSVNLEFKIAQ